MRRLALSLVLLVCGCNSWHGRPAHVFHEPPIPHVDARDTLTFLASDELEGRGIGTHGLDVAADFLAGKFAQLGLEKPPGQSDYFQLLQFTAATSVGPHTSLQIGDRALQVRKDFTPLTFSAEEKFSGEIVFVGYGVQDAAHHYDDYANVDVKNKVALAMRYEPHDAAGKSKLAEHGWSESAALTTKAKVAHDHGAVALLIISPPDLPQAALPQMIGASSAAIPVIYLQSATKDELVNREARGEVQFIRSQALAKNVIGILPGPQRDKFIVIGAHYDHLGHGGLGSLAPTTQAIHNGADDNASGTTALLILAERFRKNPPKNRSIIFAAFSAEEEGLIGSRWFVNHSPVPLEQIDYMLNLDMVGRVRNEILYIGGSGTAADLEHIVKEADDDSPLKVESFGKGGIGPSDQTSFAIKKIPVLFFFSGMHRDYHRPSDKADKINFAGLDEVAHFAEDVERKIDELPREAYVSANDSSGIMIGASGGPSRVRLGVVPDYMSDRSDGGMKIADVMPDSPAAAAGLKADDVLVRFGEMKIQNVYDLMEALGKAQPGQHVKLAILRNKKPMELEATLTAR